MSRSFVYSWVVPVGILLVLGACSSNTQSSTPAITISAEWLAYDDPTELLEASDLVVAGTVGPEVTRVATVYEEGNAPITRILHEFDVTEIYRQSERLELDVAPGTQILVGYSDYGSPLENVSRFTDGERLLLVLVEEAFPDTTVEGGTGFLPLQGDSGVFELRGETAVARGVVGPLAGATIGLGELRTIGIAVDRAESSG